ncbi:MAG TPA: Crp/Fnr family transcriptional regulator [Ideonella sp.]|uniref:Crp/Fnr family transcriptional regulator n=1 Tax=Ideonella sp. TaxID=1929293 RepID=UPI002E381715|nr:Crp/Fnr family transcriptional regulator [Ideonella sp.]HEX5685923.1 Crp/Fnr family transcriptional regulator [Ideonella sp.]
MARREIACAVFLAAVPLFKALDAATLARLAAATTRRTLRRGETLFRKGDASTGMYVVIHGEIKLMSTTPVRGSRLTGIVGPGQSFGEPVMFLERPALVDAQAAGDALVLHLPKQTLLDEIERNPKFALRMIAGLSQRIESLVRELDRQAMGSGRERFIAYLLRHGPRQDHAAPLVVTLPAAKAEVASQLNLTAEHFSRILHELATAGLLQVQGRKITVPDPNRLQRAARQR